MSSDDRIRRDRSALPAGYRITFVLLLGVAAVVLVLAGAVIGVIPAVVALALVPSARREVAARDVLGAASWRRAGQWQLRIGIALAAAALCLVVVAIVLTLFGLW